MTQERPHVVLACAGLDHAYRGFESFARECFEALRDDPGIRLELVKGTGPPGPGERAIPSLRRDSALAQSLSRARGTRAFRFEHLAFALSLQPVLLQRQPDIVFLSEWDTARGLAALRSLTRQRFRLVLSNGTFAPGGFEHLDHVQDLTPAARDHLIKRGADPERHTVLPLGFRIAPRLVPPDESERTALRKWLGLPLERRIILSVAALNRSHKRLDYLIEEVASLPERPFLLMVGQPEEETPPLRALAAERLGADGGVFLTVRASEVRDLYRASDVLVLASLAEAQGRVLVEAMAEGLPCVAHDTPVMHFALGEHGIYGDLSKRGVLAGLLAGEPPPTDDASACARHDFVYERFSWDRLRPRYVEFFRAVARSEDHE